MYPATVSIRRIWPKTASNPALPCTDSASWAREAAVGKVEEKAVSVAAIVAPKTKPHRAPARPARRAVVTATVLRRAALPVAPPHASSDASTSPSP